ncbi:hypothetical protein EGR_09364 [Echinococcus granulosus]|uniref:Uncharacterized protein n=1 Tax=Echinococcus granulosus TaxID=6210 RepID=W6U3W1_ECHGR|nr:hypothetical protein EGR_09364 [Echinococcus granulosus]EUB55798.1 hypothetical protein EGR_09364 [Echinococcus granulosus]
MPDVSDRSACSAFGNGSVQLTGAEDNDADIDE